MRYPGGKGRCFQHLISLMPQHQTYIETHLGGGAVLRHKRPAARNIGIDIDPVTLEKWSQYPAVGLELVCGDAVSYLRSFPFRGDELVYCDPPYLTATRSQAKIYRHEYTVDDHLALLTVLKALPCKVIVSSYESELYAEVLGDWRVVRFVGDSHTGPRVELAWLNFSEPAALHDYSFVGSDFREREKIKRRRTGLTRRIELLPHLERRAFLVDLARRFPDELAGLPGGSQ
jgi:DNA adenine methylase